MPHNYSRTSSVYSLRLSVLPSMRETQKLSSRIWLYIQLIAAMVLVISAEVIIAVGCFWLKFTNIAWIYLETKCCPYKGGCVVPLKSCYSVLQRDIDISPWAEITPQAKEQQTIINSRKYLSEEDKKIILMMDKEYMSLKFMVLLFSIIAIVLGLIIIGMLIAGILLLMRNKLHGIRAKTIFMLIPTLLGNINLALYLFFTSLTKNRVDNNFYLINKRLTGQFGYPTDIVCLQFKSDSERLAVWALLFYVMAFVFLLDICDHGHRGDAHIS